MDSASDDTSRNTWPNGVHIVASANADGSESCYIAISGDLTPHQSGGRYAGSARIDEGFIPSRKPDSTNDSSRIWTITDTDSILSDSDFDRQSLSIPGSALNGEALHLTVFTGAIDTAPSPEPR